MQEQGEPVSMCPQIWGTASYNIRLLWVISIQYIDNLAWSEIGSQGSIVTYEASIQDSLFYLSSASTLEQLGEVAGDKGITEVTATYILQTKWTWI